jgi:hypothetical protein
MTEDSSRGRVSARAARDPLVETLQLEKRGIGAMCKQGDHLSVRCIERSFHLMLASSRCRLWSSLVALSLGVASLTGCGTTFQPGRAAAFDVDSSRQIDDEDIRKAFEARPQLPGTLRVAYYTFDAAIAHDLDAALASVPGVVSVYRIPSLLVNGQRRVEEQDAWAAPREVTVKKLRLLAARAHADALVIVDHGYKSGGPNGLAALNVLLVPMLFTPFLDTRIDGYADAFVIDVRNGYLYGHVSEEDQRGKHYANIYDKGVDVLATEQWATLREALTKDLARLVADERARGRDAKSAVAAHANR